MILWREIHATPLMASPRDIRANHYVDMRVKRCNRLGLCVYDDTQRTRDDSPDSSADDSSSVDDDHDSLYSLWHDGEF